MLHHMAAEKQSLGSSLQEMSEQLRSHETNKLEMEAKLGRLYESFRQNLDNKEAVDQIFDQVLSGGTRPNIIQNEEDASHSQ